MAKKTFNNIIILLILIVIFIIIITIVIVNHNKSKNKSSSSSNNIPYTTYRPTPNNSPSIGKYFNSSFPFRDSCYAKGGVLDENLGNNNDDDFEGTLLECSAITERGNPIKELESEIDDILTNIKKGIYNVKTEEDRLRLYFQIVYPKNTKNLNFSELTNLWNSLELYYILPPQIEPQTPPVIKRKKNFFQTPKGIKLQQNEERPIETGPYIEVYHNGANTAYLRPFKIFAATYYYPVKGSGIWIPSGNMLTANNKIHALKLLDTPNVDILKKCGYDFITFLVNDSKDSGDPLLTIDVVDKLSGINFDNGDYNKTRKIEYSTKVLDKMINDISEGQNIRKGYKKDPDTGKKILIDIYYGGSDTVDKMLAQIARNRGYDTIQLLKEPQMGGLSGIVNIGCELVHLFEPIISQNMWIKLDPFADIKYDYPIQTDLKRYQDKNYFNMLK